MSGRTPRRSVRVPDELWEAAAIKAQRRGRSLSWVINEMLRTWTGEDTRL